MVAKQTFDREKVAHIVMEAIDLGLPIIVTVADPHFAVRATVHRGSKQEHSWLACESCYLPWPCPSAFPYGTHLKNLRGLLPDEPGRPRKRAPRAQ
jgi:hypothetical protein